MFNHLRKEMNMTQRQQTSSALAGYHGIHPKDGSHRVITLDGQKARLCGTAYVLEAHNANNGKHGYKRIKISTTPNYIPNAVNDVSILAQCKQTQQRIRLVGQIISIPPQPISVKAIAVTKPVCVPTPSAPLAPLAINTVNEKKMAVHLGESDSTTDEAAPLDTSNNTVQEKHHAREQRQLARFQRELEIINAQYEAGIDPPVSIIATSYMSHRSHATIYRDIKDKILPKPTKIGRNSMFPYSIVKAYSAGQLTGSSK
jgi:predicted DNA-binding transcriptional regulator AlpA